MKPNGLLKAGVALSLAGLALSAGCSKSYMTSPMAAPPDPTPTATVAGSPTPSPTATDTGTPTASPTPSATPTNTGTATATSTATSTPTSTFTGTPTPLPTPWVVDGTSANFNQEALQAPLPVLVVFYATWCSACQIMDPAVAQFALDEAGKVKVVLVDADAQPSLLSAYGVTGLPTCIFFNKGAITPLKLVGSYASSAADESALIGLFNQI